MVAATENTTNYYTLSRQVIIKIEYTGKKMGQVALKSFGLLLVIMNEMCFG